MSFSVSTIKIATVVWLGVVVALHTIPASGLPSVHWIAQYHLDKVVHFLMFFPLVVGAKVGFDFSMKQVLVFAILLAASLEIIQGTFVAGRTGEVGDFLADFGGIALGLGVLRVKK